MQPELAVLLANNGELPVGTRIQTTVGGIHTGGTHELPEHVLASANRVPNVLSESVLFWILGWKDLHEDLSLPHSHTTNRRT